MKESKIEKYLDREVKKRGGFTRKYTSPGRRGVPDRIVFLHNGVMFVELKTPVGELSKLQEREFKRIQDLGIAVYVIATTAGIDKLMVGYDSYFASCGMGGE